MALLTCHAKNTLVLQSFIDKKRATPVELKPQRAYGRTLSKTDLKQIVKSYKSGKSMRQIGDEFSVSRTRVSGVLKSQGIQRRRQQPIDVEVEEMVRLYSSGLSLARTGERVGFDAATVRKYLLAHGTRIRSTTGQ